MPFMVIYSTSDGRSSHEQADAIDEAALLVERLRNQEGIDDTRIYRMEEISFAFRPYYKVELGMPERLSTAPPSEVVGTSTETPPAPTPEVTRVVEPEVAVDLAAPSAEMAFDAAAASPGDPAHASDAAANGRRGLFGR